MVGRVLKIVVGVFLALANSLGGTFLGFYPPTTPERIGFDIAKVLLYFPCGWLFYTAFKPTTKQRVTSKQS